MLRPRPTCFILERHAVWRAFSRAWAKTGKRIAAKMAMMAITTSSSISVKPRRRFMAFLLRAPRRRTHAGDEGSAAGRWPLDGVGCAGSTLTAHPLAGRFAGSWENPSFPGAAGLRPVVLADAHKASAGPGCSASAVGATKEPRRLRTRRGLKER